MMVPRPFLVVVLMALLALVPGKFPPFQRRNLSQTKDFMMMKAHPPLSQCSNCCDV
jgi:hypothetical protein